MEREEEEGAGRGGQAEVKGKHTQQRASYLVAFPRCPGLLVAHCDCPFWTGTGTGPCPPPDATFGFDCVRNTTATSSGRDCTRLVHGVGLWLVVSLLCRAFVRVLSRRLAFHLYRVALLSNPPVTSRSPSHPQLLQCLGTSLLLTLLITQRKPGFGCRPDRYQLHAFNRLLG